MQVGESCPGGDAGPRHCAPELDCAATDGGLECEPRVGEGGACNGTNCEMGLRCDDEGRCRPEIEVGGACESTADCRADLTCHPTLAACVARAEIGEPCRDADGVLLQYYQPNLDLRSVFTKGDSLEPVFLRAYGNRQIRVQTAPGVYEDDVLLVAGVLDDQSAVVWDEGVAEFVSHIDGTVTRWDAVGALIGTVALTGYGDLPTEHDYPQSRGVAAACGYYLTYVGGTVSAWDVDGNRVASTTLTGAGVSFDSYFSYAQGLFFVNDGAGLSWRGYDVL